MYVFGAGINRGIKDVQNLKPPLATDLFRQALRHEMLEGGSIDEFGHLFAYIFRYWKLSVEDLREVPFDLEACFTMLQQQRIEANSDGDTAREERIARVEDQLSALLTRFLGHIELFAPDITLMEIGRRVLAESAAVLTFNYDTIIESAIEMVAGKTEETPPPEGRVPDEHLSYSDSKWNRALAYGVHFAEVDLQQTGLWLDPVEGDRFYGHPDNVLYPTPVLKLHGSLNWFVHTSRQGRSHPRELTENPKGGQVRLANGYPHVQGGFHPVEDSEGWILEPLIVTPVLYKELGGKGPVGQTWRRAREELSDCRRLVIAGYSFPPTDFAMRRLFLEAFADRTPEELVSVNPNHSVAGVVAGLCHFGKRPLVRESLEEFIDHP